MTTLTELTRRPFGKVLQDVSQAASLPEAMHLGGLDFTVQKQELESQFLDADGVSTIHYPKHRGIVRTDTRKPLAVVSDTYGIVQNHDAFAPLDYLQREGIVTGFEQAGLVNDGGKCFLLARLHSESTISDDPHHRMLLIATSHDGTGAVTARGWLHRVACANQLPAMFQNRLQNRGKAQVPVAKIRHTSKAETYLGAFRSAVFGAIHALETTEMQIVLLQQERIQNSHIDRFVKALFPIKDESLLTTSYGWLSRGEKVIAGRVAAQRHALRHLITQAPTQENVRGTRAALFHAAVEYSDYKATGKRAERIVLGRDVAFKAKALALASSV